MYARNKIVFLSINDAYVGVMNEQYNSPFFSLFDII